MFPDFVFHFFNKKREEEKVRKEIENLEPNTNQLSLF